MRLHQIRSPKHPGAVFLKVRGSHDDFVLKVYPEHADKADKIQAALEFDTTDTESMIGLNDAEAVAICSTLLGFWFEVEPQFADGTYEITFKRGEGHVERIETILHRTSASLQPHARYCRFPEGGGRDCNCGAFKREVKP